MSSNYSRRFFSRLSLCALLLFAFLILSLPSTWADSQSNVRIVRLSYVSGDVQVDRGDGQGLDRAVLNMPIVHGARLVTGSTGYGEVEFEDGSTARFTPETTAGFEELALNDEGGRVTKISLQNGTAYFEIAKHDHDVFEISVAGKVFDLRHSSHFRITEDGFGVRISVFNGALQMTGNSQAAVEIRSGETLTLE